MRSLNFKNWEKGLIVFSLSLFVFSSVVYLTNAGFISKYIFGFSDEKGHAPLGHLSKKGGSVRRKMGDESEFRKLTDQSILFDFDLLVTGEDSSAVIELDKGGSVTLGSNTMVRLAFKNEYSLAGISRIDNLEIVSGGVTVNSASRKLLISNKGDTIKVSPNSEKKILFVKVNGGFKSKLTIVSHFEAIQKAPIEVLASPSPSPIPSPSPSLAPSPSPSPTSSPSPLPRLPRVHRFTKKEAEGVQVISPVDTVFRLADYSAKIEKIVKLVWKITPPHAVAQIRVSKILDQVPGKTRARPGLVVVKNSFPAVGGVGSILFSAQAPGNYVWEIRGVKGEMLTTQENSVGHFTVDPEFEAIKTLAPWVGGEAAHSNQISGDLVKKFDITLRWEKYPGAVDYRVWIGATPDLTKKPLLEQVVSSSEYKLNKNKIYVGHFFYKVTAKLANGFIASSKLEKFSFDFLPPVLVLPQNNVLIGQKSLIDQKDISKKGYRLLITWTKTNFTEDYELEIAQDESFSSVILKKMLKVNYFILADPKEGRYWWRVRAFATGHSSPMSSPFMFTVVP